MLRISLYERKTGLVPWLLLVLVLRYACEGMRRMMISMTGRRNGPELPFLPLALASGASCNAGCFYLVTSTVRGGGGNEVKKKGTKGIETFGKWEKFSMRTKNRRIGRLCTTFAPYIW